MIIAIACEGLAASLHALHCESFMCYTVERGIIVSCRNLPNPSGNAYELVELLKDLGVSVFIAAGCDENTLHTLTDAGIDVVVGMYGNARSVVDSYLTQQLIGTDESLSI